MSALRADQVRQLLEPYVKQPLPPEVYDKMVRYLAVFAVWSSRINLSTQKEPEQVVQRHFGEGLALAAELPEFATLLDLGSGAGFPGLPIALARPNASVTLAESQKKKAGFLKEAAWMMGLPIKVWADRAENFRNGTQFDVVVLRAVDEMSTALQTAHGLLAPGGTLAFFAGEREPVRLPDANWSTIRTVEVPISPGHMVLARLAV